MGHGPDTWPAPGGPELDDVDLARFKLFHFLTLQPFGDFQRRGRITDLERWNGFLFRRGLFLLLSQARSELSGNVERREDNDE